MSKQWRKKQQYAAQPNPAPAGQLVVHADPVPAKPYAMSFATVTKSDIIAGLEAWGKNLEGIVIEEANKELQVFVSSVLIHMGIFKSTVASLIDPREIEKAA